MPFIDSPAHPRTATASYQHVHAPSRLDIEPVALYGREALLDDIDECLLPTTTAPSAAYGGLRSVLVQAMGGMGKTRLAEHWAATRRARFDAIFWLDASHDNALSADFAALDDHLGLARPDDTRTDLSRRHARVVQWLRDPTRRRNDGSLVPATWLIIFDGADDLDVLLPFWPDYGKGSVLVTSRGHSVRVEQSSALQKTVVEFSRIIPLSPYTLDQTKDMLSLLAHGRDLLSSLPDPPESDSESESSSLTKICHKLGGLPLAIEQLAGIIRMSRMSYSTCLEILERECGQDDLFVGDTPNESAVESIWKIRTFDDNARTAAAHRHVLLQLLAFCSPAGVPNDLLKRLALEGGMLAMPMSETEYHKARDDLVRRAIVHHRIQDGLVVAHDLIKDLVRSETDADGTTRTLLKVATALTRTSPLQTNLEGRFESSRWIIYGRIARHVASLLRLWEDNLNSDLDPLASLDLARLFDAIGWYMFESGSDEALDFFESCRDILAQRRDLIATYPDVAYLHRQCHNNLSAVLAESGRTEEAMLYNDAWYDLFRRHKTDSNGLLEPCYEEMQLNNERGVIFAMLGNYKEAETAFRKSAALLRGLDNFEELETRLDWPLPNLGLVLWLQGRHEEAKEVLHEIQDILTQAFGEDDTNTFKTGKMLYALGNVYHDTGDMAQSMDYHMRAYRQYTTTLGWSHFRTADAAFQLARHYMRNEDLDEAEKLPGFLHVRLENQAQHNLILTSKLLTQARQVYEIRKGSRASLCRTLALQSRLRTVQGAALARRAVELRGQVLPSAGPVEAVSVHDELVDALIMFWSR